MANQASTNQVPHKNLVYLFDKDTKEYRSLDSFDFGGGLHSTISQFNEQRVAERTPIIELNAVYPLSELRDDQQSGNNGTIENQASEYRLHHQGSGDFARLASAARGRYQPGASAEAGIGVRFDKTPSNGDYEAIFGYFEMNTGDNSQQIENGLIFGHDNTSGLFAEVIHTGESIHKTYQENWNINTGDGIDLTDGQIFQVDYTYYGYGLIKWQYVENSTADASQEVKTLHTFRPKGTTSLANSNLQVGGLVKSNNTTDDFSLFVAGRQYSVIGHYRPKQRVNSERNLNVSVGTSEFIPLVSFQKDIEDRDIPSEILGFSAISDNDLITQIRLNPTLQGSNFGSLSEQPDVETSLKSDTAATGIDINSGIKIYETIVKGGDKGNERSLLSVEELPADIPDEGIISFAAKAISTNATASVVARIKETY